MKSGFWIEPVILGWYRNTLSTELRLWPKDEEWILDRTGDIGLVSQYSIKRVLKPDDRALSVSISICVPVSLS